MAHYTRVRDSQRSKVYTWETAHIRPLLLEGQQEKYKFDSLADIRAFVDRVLWDHGLSWVYQGGQDASAKSAKTGSFVSLSRQLVNWKRGASAGHNVGGSASFKVLGYSGIDSVFLAHRLRVSNALDLVIHEVAHLMDHQINGVQKYEGHGPRYVRLYCELLSRYTKTFQGKLEELLRSAARFGVRVSSSSALEGRQPLELQTAMAPSTTKTRRKTSKKPAGSKPRRKTSKKASTKKPSARKKTTKKASTKKRDMSSCKGKPTHIARELAKKHPKLPAIEVIEMAIKKGVSPATARTQVYLTRKGKATPTKKKTSAKKAGTRKKTSTKKAVRNRRTKKAAAAA